MTPTPITLPVTELALPTDYRVDFGPGHAQHAYSHDRGHAEQILRSRSHLGEPAARLVPLWEAPQTPDYIALADWWRSHPRVPAVHAFPAGSVEQGRAMEWEWAAQHMVVGV